MGEGTLYTLSFWCC